MDRAKLLTLFVFLLTQPLLTWADSRFVETPPECHVPWDNANVDHEYKLQSCAGQLKSRVDGNRYDATLFSESDNLPGNMYVIDGQDVRDVDAYPSGVLTVNTSGADSGTDCNIVSNGTTYATADWNAVIRVYRTQDRYRVKVSYQLECWGGVAQ